MSLTDEASRLEDVACITRWRAGDESAFNALVAKYTRPIRGRLTQLYYWRLEEPERQAVLDDLLQELWWRIYRHRDKLNMTKRFSAFTYTCAVNLARNEMRNTTRRTRVIGRLPLFETEAGMEEVEFPDETANVRPDDALIHKQLQAHLEQALARLSPRHRAVVEMRMDGAAYQTIADALHIKLGTAKSRLHRAREEMRDIFEELRDS